MFTFVRVRKDQYPYETLHLSTCGAASSRRAEFLDLEQVERVDSVRIDKCKRCMPMKGDEYHPGVREFWRIQQAGNAKRAAVAQTSRLARQVVALRLALAKVEAEAAEFPGVDALIPEYTRTMADGTYTPDELDVTVGRSSITKRPNNWA